MKKEFTVLQQALQKAAEAVRRKFGKVGYELKGKANLVTAADLASQRAILALIKKHFPKHDYLAEEGAVKSTHAAYTWVIDPLDGTTNFAHTFPQYSISVALFHGNTPVLAGVSNPFSGETFLAQKGKGATLNGEKIHVSQTSTLSQALLVTGFPYNRFYHMPELINRFGLFLDACHDVRRLGSAALDLCWVAAGRLDGYWEESLQPWDVAAGTLILQEAGGRVTSFSAKPFGKINEYGQTLVASNGAIHAPMLRIIRQSQRINRYGGPSLKRTH